MNGLSRRRLLASAAGFCAAAALLPGCCWLTKLLGGECAPPPAGDWKAAADACWRRIQEERERRRAADRAAGWRPNVPSPRPWLACGKVPGSRGTLEEQARTLPRDQGGDVVVTVTNDGNAASWSCCVDLYWGLSSADGTPFSGMTRSDRKVVAVQPGAMREVVLRWQGTPQSEGFLVARCFDPLLDPAPPDFRSTDRKCDGAAWRAGGGG